MTHVSPCPKCGIEIIYGRKANDEELARNNFVLYPEILMHNHCPKCKTWLFSYPTTLDRQIRNRQ